MFNRVLSGAVQGIQGILVNVEADISDGLPIFSMVGYLASEVKEAKDRVKISIKNSGYKLSPKKVTINLSPADLRKVGTAFDLPIAIAILMSYGFVVEPKNNIMFIGELSLNGELLPVNGVLPMVYQAMVQGVKKCIVPTENAKEGAVVEGIEVIGARNLKEVVDYLKGSNELRSTKIDTMSLFHTGESVLKEDMSEVQGQLVAKRAIEVAVSGGHNILLIGPPGTGKSMLARRIPTIMPDLSLEEGLDISKIYSVSGLLKGKYFISKRPFRSPHHTISPTALVGGGIVLKPGEISLASGGVLFLDELTEFHKGILELLRQPLEDNTITISRQSNCFKFPADFMLVAAMNPCKCGYYPDATKCHCSENDVKKYLSKISRPFLDRMDLCAETIMVDYKDLVAKEQPESSKTIRERVIKARKIQEDRYKNIGISMNSELTPKMLKIYCVLGKEQQKLMDVAFKKMNLSVRGYHKILKVARTIADIDCSQEIHLTHLSEAICYRNLDNKYWGE